MNVPESPLTTDDETATSDADHNLEGMQVLLAEDCPDQGRLYLQFLQSAGASITLEFLNIDTGTFEFDAPLILLKLRLIRICKSSRVMQLSKCGVPGGILISVVVHLYSVTLLLGFAIGALHCKERSGHARIEI